MPWETCNIILNSGSTGCFSAGDIVTGTIVVKFQEKRKIEHFNLDVTGISRASWTRPMPTIPYIKIYSEKRVVLKVNTLIFTEFQGKEMSPGTYTYPFHFSLPLDLPSTFRSSIAKVSYHIKVHCKAAYKFKKKTSVPFKVLRTLDLNHLDHFLVPTFTEMHKIFWDSRKISMELMSYSGFSPNQIIDFEATICNKQRVKISKLSVTLLQQMEYNVSSGYLQKDKKLENVCYSQFENTAKESCHFSMTIPQTPPTCDYSMIKVAYKLLVELVFTYHFTLSKYLPVTISTVPVMHAKFTK